jgi:hypothetical protein
MVQSHVSYRWTTSQSDIPSRAETTIIQYGSMRAFSSRARLLLAALGLLLFARNAAAQPAAYITGSAFADIKRFSSTNGINYYGNDGQQFSLDGTGPGGGLRIGTFLNPRWSLELAADVGARTKSNLPDPYRILEIPVPVGIRQLKVSTKFVTVSATIGFHPAARRSVRLGYLAGLSFIRETYKSDYPNFGVPVPLFSTAGSALGTAIGSPVVFPPPIFVVRTVTQKNNATGVILGFEAAIDLASHVAVVPEIRAVAFSTPNSGPAVFLIRPGVAVRWNF